MWCPIWCPTWTNMFFIFPVTIAMMPGSVSRDCQWTWEYHQKLSCEAQENLCTEASWRNEIAWSCLEIYVMVLLVRKRPSQERHMIRKKTYFVEEVWTSCFSSIFLYSISFISFIHALTFGWERISPSILLFFLSSLTTHQLSLINSFCCMHAAWTIWSILTW